MKRAVITSFKAVPAEAVTEAEKLLITKRPAARRLRPFLYLLHLSVHVREHSEPFVHVKVQADPLNLPDFMSGSPAFIRGMPELRAPEIIAAYVFHVSWKPRAFIPDVPETV